jgi:Uri superfamily endonuclease
VEFHKNESRDTKRRHWQVDDLLQKPEAELVGVCALRHPHHIEIETELGKLLELDQETLILAKGLGATDVKGNTHLLRVQSDEIWWRLLPLRMEALARRPRSDGLAESYVRGRRCLRGPADAVSNGRVSLAKGTVVRTEIRNVSAKTGLTDEVLIKDVKFAKAVDTIMANCGEKAIEAIFFSRYPQTRKAIESVASPRREMVCSSVFIAANAACGGGKIGGVSLWKRCRGAKSGSRDAPRTVFPHPAQHDSRDAKS